MLNADSDMEVTDCTFLQGDLTIQADARVEVAGCDFVSGSLRMTTAGLHRCYIRANRLRDALIETTRGDVWISDNELEGGGIRATGTFSASRNRFHGCADAIVARGRRNAGQSIQDNVIYDCTTGIRVEGFYEDSTGVGIVGNTIVGCDPGIYVASTAFSVGVVETCNDVWDNETNWNGVPDPTGVDGNISEDPLFCSWTDGSFLLQPSSPCLPYAGSCGLIGASLQGCTNSPIAAVSWGELKEAFRP
jgi:hypothetical protein